VNIPLLRLCRSVLGNHSKEIKSYYPSKDDYYQYYDQSSASSMNLAISQLSHYIDSEGPFDGVIGYSQGASLAATFLIRYAQQHPSSPLPFKCAIFFSGGKPLNPSMLDMGKLELIDPKVTGTLLKLPTANIWGRNDMLWPGSSEVLCDICEEGTRSVALHDEGHDIPGVRAKDAVQSAVRAIRRAVDKALINQ
jgi:predicted esterase